MKKKLSVICLAFLGMTAVQDVLAADTKANLSENKAGQNFASGSFANKNNGIMKENYIFDKRSQRNKKAQEKKFKEDVQEELSIEEGKNQIFKLDTEIDQIFVSDPKIADIQTLDNHSFYVRGESPGVTYLKFYDKNGDVLGNYIIRVTYKLDEIKRAISEVFPDLELDFVSINDQLMVKGEVPSPEMARDVMDIIVRFVKTESIINKITIATATQVLLKVKIAEVTRNVKKSLGIDWRTLSSTSSSSVIGMAAGGSTKEFPEFTSSVATELLKDEGILSADVLGGRWVVSAGMNNLAALIDAVATETFGTILAEPNLVALSGQKAKFESGGQYGYTVNQGDSGSNKTTEFKDWGTILEFTPIVLSEDRINVKVKTEVSSIGKTKDDDSAPELDKKIIETVVELGSGQSMVLAGLLQKTQKQTSIETPFLADIPLIGSLFKSAAPELDERELVVVVTPYIVKPSSKKLKTPVDAVPKLLSPLKSITKRRFTSVNNKSADSAGFSIK